MPYRLFPLRVLRDQEREFLASYDTASLLLQPPRDRDGVATITPWDSPLPFPDLPIRYNLIRYLLYPPLRNYDPFASSDRPLGADYPYITASNRQMRNHFRRSYYPNEIHDHVGPLGRLNARRGYKGVYLLDIRPPVIEYVPAA